MKLSGINVSISALTSFNRTGKELKPVFTIYYNSVKRAFSRSQSRCKKQPASSSASGTRPGKTNDPYTPEEIAELKKVFCTIEQNPNLKAFILTPREQYIYDELKKRKNNLHSFCKNCNIAKQTDTYLGGLAGKSGYRWKKQMSGKEVIAMLKKNGWEHVKTKGGSHQKFVKGVFSYPIPFHSNTMLGKGLLIKIKKDIMEIENKINNGKV